MRVKDIEKKSRGVPHTSTKVLMSMTESATSVAVDGELLGDWDALSVISASN